MTTPVALPPSRLALGYSMGLLAGLSSAAQARANGGLAAHIGSGLLAALVNFTVGLALIAVVVMFSARARRGVVLILRAVRENTMPWWVLAGGVFGAFLVVTQATSVPVIGVALFSIGVIAGQTVNSLIVDRFGLGTTAPVPITGRRVLGAVGAALAVVVAVSNDSWNVSGTAVFLLLLCAVAGALVAFQQGINARVAITAQTPLTATLANFIVGSIALLAVVGVSGAAFTVDGATFASAPPWAFLGGLFGASFIGLSAAGVPLLGVLSFALVAIAGQLAGAVLLDAFWPSSGTPVTINLILGTLLALAAAFLGRRRGAPAGRT